MITVAGITLPDSAVWVNELDFGQPVNSSHTCTGGTNAIFMGETSTEIDIYIPKIAGELTRQTVMSLKNLADSGNQLAVNINGKLLNAVFRHTDTALELKPINAKQQQSDNDSYYGYVRLTEV